MPEITLPHNWSPRDYQQPAWDSVPAKYSYGVFVWHRRAGKDSLSMNKICVEAHQRVGVYWHMLPTQKQARKVVWDGIDRYGRRMIDVAFPKKLRKSTNNTEMRIEFKNGSIFQCVGSDNYDNLVGSNPIGIVFSEYSVAKPAAWDYIRPILKENGGWAIFIYTSRGRNHGWDMAVMAAQNPKWYFQTLTVLDTGVLSEEDIQEERDAGMSDTMIEQEYYCSFDALNEAVIFGTQMQTARNEERIDPNVTFAPDLPIHVSCDLGHRDAAAFWFWQPTPDGFQLIDYMEQRGLDAEQWLEQKLRPSGWDVDTLWLPHDARNKTFQSRHTVMEQFLRSKWATHVRMVPKTSIVDRINAGRVILNKCWFNEDLCLDGIRALENWHYLWDEDRKTFSQNPDHDWSSHGADAFTYGAQVLRDYVAPVRAEPKDMIQVPQWKLDELWSTAPKPAGERCT